MVYLRQEGRGIGLHAKIQAYNLQDKGADTHDANLMLGHPVDARNYNIASVILNSIGIEKICLMTNNPEKVKQLNKFGIGVEETVPLIVGVVEENKDYLVTKVDRMGHSIDEDFSKLTYGAVTRELNPDRQDLTHRANHYTITAVCMLSAICNVYQSYVKKIYTIIPTY